MARGMLPDWPFDLKIRDEVYPIRYVTKFRDPKTMGECDPHKHEIRIKKGLTPKQEFRTIIHEILHALEFEYDLEMKHQLVYDLEKPLYRLFKDNFL